jgi:hypothetical protein
LKPSIGSLDRRALLSEDDMGLDGVEIVLRTEETFGIEIPDNIAARILTPAALIDFVAANVPLKLSIAAAVLPSAPRIPIPAESSDFDVRSGYATQRHSSQGSMAAGLAGDSR